MSGLEEDKVVKFDFVRTDQNKADFFTKKLATGILDKACRLLSLFKPGDTIFK